MPQSYKGQPGDRLMPVWIAIGVLSALLVGESAGIEGYSRALFVM
jgi:hypothetical protein